PRRWHGAESATAELLDDDPSAHAVPGVHRVHRAVRLRDRGAAQWTPGHPLDHHHPTLDPGRVVLPDLRDHLRDDVGVRGTGLGWLLVLGPGRERFTAALAHRNCFPAFGDDPGEARHAEDVEPVPHHGDVPAEHLRHLPDALGA